MRELYKQVQIPYLYILTLLVTALLAVTAIAAEDEFSSAINELIDKEIQGCVADINQQADDKADASQRFYDTAICYLCSGCDIALQHGERFESDSLGDFSITHENYEITYKLLQQSAELGSEQANYALALVLYLTGSAEGALAKDKIYLREYEKLQGTVEYKKLQSENNNDALLKRISKLENDVFLKKHKLDFSNEIHMRLLVAAQQGHIPSQFALGEVYSRGIGVSPNKVQAYAWSATAVAQDPPFGSTRRDLLASDMDAFELNEAESLAESFMKQYTSIFDRSSVTVMR